MTFPFPIMLGGYEWGSSTWTDFKDKWAADTYLGSYSTGVIMPDWTPIDGLGSPASQQVVSLPGSISGQAFHCVGGSGVNQIKNYIWAQTSSITDADILMGIVMPAVYGTSRPVGGIISNRNAADIFRSCYVNGANSPGLVAATTFQTPQTILNGSLYYSMNTWYWMRARKSGASLSGKFWHRGSAEPASWNVSLVSAYAVVAGGCGLSFNFYSGVQCYFDFFSVSTDGTPAWGPV